jgi:hypothetical protein
MRCHRTAILSSAVVAVAFALLATACGGGSRASHVAQLGSTSTTTQAGRSSAGSGASTAGGSITSQTLAYSRCMRVHGVPTFPDPDSNGLPKTQVVSARQADPSRFDSANTACRHLVPSGGTNGGNGETPAQIAQDWTDLRRFARCMRSHGVPNWPDPTSRSPSDNRPAFNLTAAGLYPNSQPQLITKAQHCVSLLHLSGLPAAH